MLVLLQSWLIKGWTDLSMTPRNFDMERIDSSGAR
jgi:hypothetical protein